MSRKIVTLGSGSKMPMTKFVNDYCPKYLKKLTKDEKEIIQTMEKNSSFFVNMETGYLCKVTRTM